jgi:hypothetical protein
MLSRKTTAVLGVLVLVVAIVLFVVLQGGSGSGDGGASRALTFRLENGQAAGEARNISVTQGDHLTVRLHTDVPAELHIHGYELAKDIKAGGTGSISFTADATGEFEIEAHHLVHGEEGPGVSLATLEVNP